MQMRAHAIVTACDAKCGDFLGNHWLPSLRDNVRLDHIDVVILDYGLSPEQRESIDRQGAIRLNLPRDGFVNNLRWRDLITLTDQRDYDQLLLIDSGDIIFQADISHLFEQHQRQFRAVCEEMYTAQYEHFISTADFYRPDYERMVEALRGKRIVNSGAVLGPAAKFRKIWPAARRLVRDLQHWGTLQLVLNYFFYQEGFVELPYAYNFIIMTARSKYRIRNGQFFDREGKLIPVVHNAGGANTLRFVKDFGYGPGHNHPKWIIPTLLKPFFAMLSWWNDRQGRETPAAPAPAPVAAPHLLRKQGRRQPTSKVA